MKIYFFEEFEKQENIEKVKLIDFPTKIIYAARSMKQFKGIQNQLKKYRNVKDVIYWPVLTKEEGYYISAFSKTSGLQRIFGEILEAGRTDVMLDLEIPLERDVLSFLWTIAKRFPSYFRNRKLILEFLNEAKKRKINVYTAEYDLPNPFALYAYRFCLLKLSQKYRHKSIIMLYTSILEKQSPGSYLKMQLKKCKGEFLVGLGTITTGILRDEPILSPAHLERDLNIMKKEGIKEVVIFRLGGLTKEYVDVIKNCLD